MFHAKVGRRYGREELKHEGGEGHEEEGMSEFFGGLPLREISQCAAEVTSREELAGRAWPRRAANR